MAQVYLSLMSNFENRGEYLNRALWAVNALPETKVTNVGRVYETAINGEKPENFLTAAVRIETELSPKILLGALHGIEAAMGRNRSNKACVIDLDILMYEDCEIADRELTLPHPEIMNRPYILSALLSIYADRAFKDQLREIDDGNTKVTGEGLYMPL